MSNPVMMYSYRNSEPQLMPHSAMVNFAIVPGKKIFYFSWWWWWWWCVRHSDFRVISPWISNRTISIADAAGEKDSLLTFRFLSASRPFGTDHTVDQNHLMTALKLSIPRGTILVSKEKTGTSLTGAIINHSWGTLWEKYSIKVAYSVTLMDPTKLVYSI